MPKRLPTSSQNRYRLLERLLLHGTLPAGATEAVRRAKLGAYAYTRLEAKHSERAGFQADYAAALYQHLTTRAALLPLLRAWHANGIEVLLFKGFYLSEFVYPVPGQRPYGDVDLLMEPANARRAAGIAKDLGWRETWRLEASLVPHHHELLHLQSPDGQACLDVHRRVLHNLLPSSGQQQRITGAVWAAATHRDWEGVPVRLPDPRDAVLVGLVLQRAWGDDSWVLKVRDWPDFCALIERHGLQLEELRDRARELGCARTLAVFLGLCDPFRLRLHLRPRTRLEYLWRGVRILPERPSLLFEHTMFRWWDAWHKGVNLLQALPHVLRVLWHLRRADTLAALATSVTVRAPAATPQRGARTDEREVQGILRGVHLALDLLRVRPQGNCLESALAVYSALRARGYRPVFCSGVIREGSAIRSHAWVELADTPLADPWQPPDAHRYRRNFEFPVPPHPL